MRGKTTSLQSADGPAGTVRVAGRGAGRGLAVPRNAGKESLPGEGSASGAGGG